MKKHALPMSDADIVSDFRQAKNKPAQVRILAQLNATSVEVIKRILLAAGEDGRQMPRTKKKAPSLSEKSPKGATHEAEAPKKEETNDFETPKNEETAREHLDEKRSEPALPPHLAVLRELDGEEDMLIEARNETLSRIRELRILITETQNRLDLIEKVKDELCRLYDISCRPSYDSERKRAEAVLLSDPRTPDIETCEEEDYGTETN